jgi:hypothetical protein
MCIQSGLKAPKNQMNNFGGYNYRSCEDIMEAVKPLLREFNVVLTVSDEMVLVGDRIYVKATATLSDGEDNISNSAFAREAESKKGMDESQITGAASSYARKYALNGLFAIDDTKDADTDQYKQQTSGAQNAQNSAGRTQNAKPNNYTKAPTKASQNDDLMAKAKKQLKAEVDRIGCTWDEVKAISGVKIGKVKTEEMTVGEVSQLAAKLEQWILEESASA